jgi:hypothetical protein
MSLVNTAQEPDFTTFHYLLQPIFNHKNHYFGFEKCDIQNQREKLDISVWFSMIFSDF